jgi:hypothetical protein
VANVTVKVPDDRSPLFGTVAGGLSNVTLWVTADPQLKFTVPPAPMSTAEGSKAFAPLAPTDMSADDGKLFVTVSAVVLLVI